MKAPCPELLPGPGYFLIEFAPHFHGLCRLLMSSRSHSSLVISFVAMRQYSVYAALAFDADFETEGFGTAGSRYL